MIFVFFEVSFDDDAAAAAAAVLATSSLEVLFRPLAALFLVSL